MKIAVVGTGYVGLVTGVCLASTGHQVACVDIDEAKVRAMQAGQMPIYETGLEEIFLQTLEAGYLTITTDLAPAVAGAEAIFLALPTPPGADGSADLSAVLKVADQLGLLLNRYTVVVDKSTVPVGTGERVYARIAANAKIDFDVVSNPEFLREGVAVEDFTHPDRIVIGSESPKARDVMERVYANLIERPEQMVHMDIRSAEMTKYAANSFLAMKVSFMNEMANLCELVGAEVDAIRLGIGPDQRTGKKFLNAGIGYGGSCFPKDVQALQQTSRQYNYDFRLLNSIVDVNKDQKKRLFDKVSAYYGKDLAGKHFALWGLAFKPGTDDIREAPALELIKTLLEAGAAIRAFDPEAMLNVRKHFGEYENLTYAVDAYDALTNADALLLVTEWKEFAEADTVQIKQRLRTPVIFDGRNVYDVARMQSEGFYYSSIGRPLAKPASVGEGEE
jgi:UDPglucose 6-dehydrogenase